MNNTVNEKPCNEASGPGPWSLGLTSQIDRRDAQRAQQGREDLKKPEPTGVQRAKRGGFLGQGGQSCSRAGSAGLGPASEETMKVGPLCHRHL